MSGAHPLGERSTGVAGRLEESVPVDSFAGKVEVRWAPEEAVTPLGQLPFFVDFLKQADLFDPFVREAPLHYTSPNAPRVRDVLGTLLLSVVSRASRYAHVNALRYDGVNPGLLGMSRVCSDDAVRRAIGRMDPEEAGLEWEPLTLAQLYRDRADTENAFDELKNQWGCGGFVTQDLNRTRIMVHLNALIYTWWSLFVRMIDPESRREARTSRPQMMEGVGRVTRHGRQTTLLLTVLHSVRRDEPLPARTAECAAVDRGGAMVRDSGSRLAEIFPGTGAEAAARPAAGLTQRPSRPSNTTIQHSRSGCEHLIQLRKLG